MDLSQETIERMIKQKEIERLLVSKLDFEPGNASWMASNILRYQEEIKDILDAKYEIKVARV